MAMEPFIKMIEAEKEDQKIKLADCDVGDVVRFNNGGDLALIVSATVAVGSEYQDGGKAVVLLALDSGRRRRPFQMAWGLAGAAIEGNMTRIGALEQVIVRKIEK